MYKLLNTIAALTIAMCATAAFAQHYPNKPIRMIVPWTAGGVTDITARILGERMGQSLGQPIVVELRAGAGSKIGTEAVARATPDGYTLLFQNSVHSLLPVTAAPLNYDPVKDFTPIVLLASYPFTLVVHPSVPANTVQELIDYAKKNPGKLAFGTGGPGTGTHMSAEMFKLMAGVDMLHVPYKGASAAQQGTIAGEVQLTFDGAAKAPVEAGRLRALATTDIKRDTRFPNLPTIAEAGVPGYQFGNWQGIWAPAGVPRDVVTRLNSAANAAIGDPSVRAKFTDLGLSLVGGTPEEFDKRVRADIEATRKVATDAKLKFN
jgi:tripartite-type tricarboxylate transporter receptor subunit TctC